MLSSYRPNNEIKISIIVPIYNTEEYVEKCILSLVNQTLQDIEIILIDDASTDRSSDIMMEYQEAYNDMIKCIFLEENIHQGGARNRGMEVAEGEYIMFVDSDDTIDRTTCEKLYIKAKESNSDIVFCDILKKYEGTSKELWFSYVFQQQLGDMTEEKKKMFFFSEGYPVAKIIRRDLIYNNNIRYPEKMKYEDFAIVIIFYLCAKKTEYIPEPLYIYNIREDSTSKKKNSKAHYDYVKATNYLLNALTELGIKSHFEEEFEAIYTYGILHSIKKIVSQFDSPDIDIIYELCQTLNTKYPDYKNNKYLFFQSEPLGILTMDYAGNSRSSLESAIVEGIIKESTVNYDLYYSKFKNTILELFEDCKSKNWTIAIWGAGKKGTDFLRVCDEDREYIYCVIDKDINKIGKLTQTGHKILSFEEVKDKIDVIISMNRYYHSGIKEEVKFKDPDKYLINLDVLLAFGKREYE